MATGPRPDRNEPPTRTGPNELLQDRPWFRPTLTFLVGLLLGVLVMADVHPVLAASRDSLPPEGTACRSAVEHSRALADLAEQAGEAAADPSSVPAADLASVRKRLADESAQLDQQLADCH